MFVVERSIYCTQCRKVGVKDWQFEDAVEAYKHFLQVSEEMMDSEQIPIGIVQMSHALNSHILQLMYSTEKSIDTTTDVMSALVLIDGHLKAIHSVIRNAMDEERKAA